MSVTSIRVPGWAPPKGYADGMVAEGRFLFIAGQIGWNPASARFESDDFLAQVTQALDNVAAVVAAAGASADGLARMTWYVTDKHAYRTNARAIGVAYRARFGRHFPAMTLIEVKSLLEDRALVEIEAVVALPAHIHSPPS
jgi:enamine deaminase RidA (YjgF/YER057c/UK114 family)